MRAKIIHAAILFAGALSVVGCGPDDAADIESHLTALARKDKDRINIGGAAPTPTPSPTEAPAETVVDPQSGATQLAMVADNIDTSTLLRAVDVASSGEPDVVGAFRFLCAPSHISYDDPIVHPGVDGGNEHLHIFFGNTQTNARSTYQSLRQGGDSTCRNMLNRSAYWQPTMLGQLTDGSQVVVVEEYTNFYYKRRPAGDPDIEGIPVAIPRGLRFVFGGPDHPARFKCLDETGNRNVTDWLPTLQEALSACAAGQHIDMAQNTPHCWDGKNLDSPDHRSHMAYTVRNLSTNWEDRCPSTHPYVMPRLNFQRIFKIRADDITTTWHLSGDMPGHPPGSMAHADYMMAWNDEVMERLMAACINKLLNCSAGDLGDGAKMVENEIYKGGMAATARRVPVPRRGEVVSLIIK